MPNLDTCSVSRLRDGCVNFSSSDYSIVIEVSAGLVVGVVTGGTLGVATTGLIGTLICGFGSIYYGVANCLFDHDLGG